MATASSISPSGMQLAGKYGIGVLSIASNSTEGIQALPTQWGFAEEAAAIHGSTVDRRDWRVLMAFHLAETREQAGPRPSTACTAGTTSTTCGRSGGPGAVHVEDAWELLERTTAGRRRGRRRSRRRHARRPGRGDPPPPGAHRRVRRRARLRPRLGQPRGDAALVGARRPLRRARAQRLHRQPARLPASTCTTTRPS